MPSHGKSEEWSGLNTSFTAKQNSFALSDEPFGRESLSEKDEKVSEIIKSKNIAPD